MTREQAISKWKHIQKINKSYIGDLNISTLINKIYDDFEINEEKLKREWYVMGSNDNFKALIDSGDARKIGVG